MSVPKIVIQRTKSKLFQSPTDEEIRQVAHVAFPATQTTEPTVRDFRLLLRAIYAIAPRYNLMKVR